MNALEKFVTLVEFPPSLALEIFVINSMHCLLSYVYIIYVSLIVFEINSTGFKRGAGRFPELWRLWRN